MAYLPAERYPLWKALLRDGTVDLGFAASRRIGAGEYPCRDRRATRRWRGSFQRTPFFMTSGWSPIWPTTGRAHPDLAGRMQSLIETTQRNKHALVHGDVSPKNILCGPDGPVFLDAECAWWGDPAFDLAFCLNHLMLKCLWVPAAAHGLAGQLSRR